MKPIVITNSNLETKLGMIEKKFNGPTYEIGKKITFHSHGSNDDKLLNNLYLVFAAWEELRLQVETNVSINNGFSQIYSTYVAAEYGLNLFGDAGNGSNTRTRNYFKVENIDFSKQYPYPREDMLSVLSKSLIRTDLSLDVLISSYFSWMRDQALSFQSQYMEKFPEIIKNLKVKIGDDFEVNGFLKPLPPMKKSNLDKGWSEFAGYPDVVDYFKDLVLIIQNYDYALKLGTLSKKDLLPKGTLLMGPPGTGKTTITRIFCKEAGVPFMTIGVTDIGDTFFSGSAQKMQEKFNDAAAYILRGGYKVSVMFMDELDGYLSARTSNDKEGNKWVITFNDNMKDGNKEVDGVIVVGATNNYSLLDAAVQSRFSSKFYMGPPDYNTTKQIFDVYLNKRSNTKKITEKDIESIISHGLIGDNLETKTESQKMGKPVWTGRIIKDITDRAYRNKLIEHLKTGGPYMPILDDFVREIENYRVPK